MGVLRFVGLICTNKVGSECDFEFEVDEAVLPEEPERRREVIEDMARDAAFEHVEWNYTQVEEP